MKTSRCEDEKMRRCEDERMRRLCEDVKMFDRPPLLEEPFAQTLSGISSKKYALQSGFHFVSGAPASTPIHSCKLQT